MKTFASALLSLALPLMLNAQQKLLYVSHGKQVDILDKNSGQLSGVISGTEGVHGIAFDQSTKTIYTSNGEGTISVIHEDQANTYSKLKDIATQEGARTICLDSQSHLLYLSVGNIDPKAKDGNGRTKVIPGSFKVLVVGS